MTTPSGSSSTGSSPPRHADRHRVRVATVVDPREEDRRSRLEVVEARTDGQEIRQGISTPGHAEHGGGGLHLLPPSTRAVRYKSQCRTRVFAVVLVGRVPCSPQEPCSEPLLRLCSSGVDRTQVEAASVFPACRKSRTGASLSSRGPAPPASPVLRRRAANLRAGDEQVTVRI